MTQDKDKSTPPRPSTVELLSEQCNRLKYGQCSTRRCLVRGGYAGAPVNYDIATCEIFEAVSVVNQCKEALRSAKRLCDNINEFGRATDQEFHDEAEAKIKDALSALEQAQGESTNG